MSVNFLFHYESDEPNPFFSTLGYWDNLKASFGFDEVIIIDLNGTFLSRGRLLTYSSLNEAIEADSNQTFVFLMAPDDIPVGRNYKNLHEFTHPSNNVTYVFGHDIFGLGSESPNIRETDEIVSILTIDNRALWACAAGAIVAESRIR